MQGKREGVGVWAEEEGDVQERDLSIDQRVRPLVQFTGPLLSGGELGGRLTGAGGADEIFLWVLRRLQVGRVGGANGADGEESAGEHDEIVPGGRGRQRLQLMLTPAVHRDP